MLLSAVDGQQKIGDQPTHDLHHETVSGSGYQVVHLEMPFPPPEEGLYVPAQFVYLCYLFCGQVVPVGGYIP